MAGAGLVALSLLLPHPSGGDISALIATAAAVAIAGLLCWFLSRRTPPPVAHLALAATAVATGLLIWESGVAVGQYESIFVWATLIAAYFFPRRMAIAHLAWLLAVYAVALVTVEGTGSYSPLTRWIFTAVSLSMVMGLTSAIVARRTKADLRARRFFDLSHDMLCTSDMEGYFVELNAAWEDCLGYDGEELRAAPFIEFVHPEDRPVTEAEAAGLYDGAGTVGFENRYLAKDGSWHWLRWSATLAADEWLVYARATDVTALKRVESERENLLTEVAALARSDALTGLPNRRALDEQLPREMARARRAESGLCLAIVDLDRFKAYNDTHGHLAGDEMRAQLRPRLGFRVAGGREGHDRPLRRRGVPRRPPRQRARAGGRDRRTPAGGDADGADLLGWSRLLGLRRERRGPGRKGRQRPLPAKAEGRDRLVLAPSIES